MKQIFWIFISFFIFSGAVLAQDNGLSLTTSPLPVNLVAEPGTAITTQLKVKNNGLEKETLTLGLMKFQAFGEEGKPKLLDREIGDDYFDWVSFSENDFELAPNEWKTITMTINVPAEAAFGYYYAVTFARKDSSVTGLGTTKIVGATACLVLLEVRVQNAVRSIVVNDFLSSQKIYEFLPAKFFIRLKNRGNVHVVPRGNIFIDRGNDRDVGVLEINDVKGNVLPNSSRIFEASWNDGFPNYVEKKDGNKMLLDKKGNVKTELKWDLSQFSKFRWGKYTANMLLIYDDGTRDVPIEAKVDFWVIPYRIILVVLAILIPLVFGLWTIIGVIFRKVFGKKKDK
ncbi:hypothetical protein KBC75_03900 [Candidatus Shapirobacteria bacterium]|nr:hypothetical protein [Candidatus Shapirobacteria bacterium]